MKRAVVATGGTGGHIFPALAVAKALAAKHDGLQVVFVGGSGPERELAAKAGLRFVSLPARGVFGRGLKGALGAVWTVGSLAKARSLYKEFRPEVVAGFGGYAGFCPVLAAKLCGLPTAVHEQNSVPGMTNKMLSRLVDRVFVTYRDEAGVFPKGKTVQTGNPVRGSIAALWRAPRPRSNTKHILVLGGSQGARAVNEAVLAALPALLDAGISLTLQTGREDFARTVEEIERLGPAGDGAGRDGKKPRVVVENFIENMAEAYAQADLVIARAGATTLAEVTVAGRPSILIPFPFATHNHQYVNAKALEDAGAAVLIEQRDLDPAGLAVLAAGLLEDTSRAEAMAEAAGGLALPEAAGRIADELTALAATKGAKR